MANSRPKIAAVTTTYFKYSHAQHIVDRFLDGYGWNGVHQYPPMDLVSLYVDEPDPPRQADFSRERLARHSEVKGAKTIADALTLGAGKLAVDAVVLVGALGHHPRNATGHTKSPRHEAFKQIVEVFRSSG